MCPWAGWYFWVGRASDSDSGRPWTSLGRHKMAINQSMRARLTLASKFNKIKQQQKCSAVHRERSRELLGNKLKREKRRRHTLVCCALLPWVLLRVAIRESHPPPPEATLPGVACKLWRPRGPIHAPHPTHNPRKLPAWSSNFRLLEFDYQTKQQQMHLRSGWENWGTMARDMEIRIP